MISEEPALNDPASVPLDGESQSDGPVRHVASTPSSASVLRSGTERSQPTDPTTSNIRLLPKLKRRHRAPHRQKEDDVALPDLWPFLPPPDEVRGKQRSDEIDQQLRRERDVMKKTRPVKLLLLG